MRKEIFNQIDIPEGIELTVNDSTVTVKGEQGENSREFNTTNLELSVKDGQFVIGSPKATRTEKKMIFTITAHVNNMIKGASEKFEYKLKICFHHFPFTLDIVDNTVTIKNFQGEKIPRVSKIIPGAEVKVDKEIITVTSANKEIAGQTAANFEAATKIKNRDRRIFQDGIFLISKAGKAI